MNLFNGSHNTCPQDLPADDPLGLADWAASHALAPATGLAVVAAVLANTAGPSLRFGSGPPATRDAPGLNLAGLATDHFLKMAISDLTERLWIMQDQLLIKSREFTAEELDGAMYDHGPFSRTNEQLSALAHSDTAQPDSTVDDLQNQLEQDMEISPKSVNFEKMIRPRFLVQGSPTPKILSECHGGYGFVAGGVEVLPCTKRDPRIDELLRLINGMEIMRPPSRNKTKINADTVRLRGILLFQRPDLDWLIARRRDFLGQAIPISSTADPMPVDEDRAAHFKHGCRRMASYCLGVRRARAAVAAQFGSKAASDEFLRLQRAFLCEMQQLPEDLRIQEVAGLPAVMAWALLLLASNNSLDEYVLQTAFAAARQVQAAAIQVFREHDQADLAERRLKVARKLVKRLTRLGPCKRRELLRGLDQQCLSIHGPVIQALIDLNIFIEGPDRILEIGTVPLARLEAKQLIETGS